MQKSLGRKVTFYSDVKQLNMFYNQVGTKERLPSVSGKEADFFYTIRLQGEPPRTDMVIPRDFEVTRSSQVENRASYLGNALKHLLM